MKCPLCQTEMERGTLSSHGQLWTSKGGTKILPKWLLFGGKVVYAWSCPKCGKIELQREIEEKK